MPARSKTTSLDPYITLRDEIIANERLPNERLVESDLSQRFGTNRNVIRAVLARLDDDGLIVREPNRGARVRVITAAEACQVIDVRAALEALVARHAAEVIDASGILVLRGIIADMQASLKDRDFLTYTKLNGTLHAAILDISGHAIAGKFLEHLRTQSVRSQYRAVFVPDRAAASLAEHENLVDAIARRNPDDAEAAMRFHLNHVLLTIKELAKFGLHG